MRGLLFWPESSLATSFFLMHTRIYWKVYEGFPNYLGQCICTRVSLINAVPLPALCQAEGPVVTAQYDCLGCVHPISTASPDLEPVLRHAIEHFNNNTAHSHLFAVREVKRAHRQVCSLIVDFTR